MMNKKSDFKINVVRFRVINPKQILSPHKNNKKINLDKANFISYKSKTIGSSELLFLLSIYSCEKFLIDANSVNLKIEIDADNFQEYFKKKYDYLRDFCLTNSSTGTLVLGGDVIFRSYSSFENFSQMNMFNFASIKNNHVSRVGDRLNVKGGGSKFEYYMNADVMYFAPNTNASIWEVGDSWRNNWVEGIWEYEQDMYNAMFRFQNGSTKPEVYSQYAYQLPVNELSELSKLFKWNNIEINDAKLIHLHSSRDLELSLKVASKILEGDLDFKRLKFNKTGSKLSRVIQISKEVIRKFFKFSKIN